MLKSKILIIVFGLMICFCSCQSSANKEEELQLKEKELKLKEREQQLNAKEKELEFPMNKNSDSTTSKKDETIGTSKFCYVKIETDEPERELVTDEIGKNSISSHFVAKHKYFTYKSEITEIQNYSETKKLKFCDDYENPIAQGLESNNEFYERKDAEMKCKLLSTKCFVFDTYIAASESRHQK